MNVFLMFRDRNADPHQILIRRDNNYRSRNRDENLNLEQLLPWNQKALIQDLGLDILFEAVSGGDKFLLETAMAGILPGMTDADTILYRQQVLKDCIENELIVRDIYQLTIEAIEKEKSIYGWGGLLGRTPTSILHQAISKLLMFSEMLRKLKSIAEQNISTFNSNGFKRLFMMLEEELSDEYLRILNEHLEQLKFNEGILVSAELGYGNKGVNYVLNKPPENRKGWRAYLFPKKIQGYTYRLHPRDDAGARALSELENKSINLAANTLARSMEHILSFFQALRTELAFYIGCLNLKQKLTELQLPICFPSPLLPGTLEISFSGLYDAGLALSSRQPIVGNNLTAEGKNFIVITGANTGGKTTFIRSIGLAQLMMQAGMFVPAIRFSSEIRSNIITHFKREEDITMESGKLDEELNRMNEIVDRINSKSLLLLNESFAATNEQEGSEIADQVTSALIGCGIKVIYVTHLYEFACRLYEKGIGNVIFLRAERLQDGTRTFRIIEGEPLQTSFGEDLYNKIFN